MSAGDDLHRALAELAPRERDVLRHHAEQAARKWSGTLPTLGKVWAAFGSLVADVETLQRARAAADADDGQHLRPARRPRA
jgi:hypothetical protein